MPSYANVDLVKEALDNGATYGTGANAGRIIYQNTAYYLLLQDGAWSLHPSIGVPLFNRTHFDMMKASDVISGGDYTNCFATAQAAEQQLASVTENGVTKAKLIDP